MKAFASALNELANAAEQSKKVQRARILYKLSSFCAPSWSVPHYNRGLLEKNHGNWKLSLLHNQIAVKLAPDDEDAWWNLGIAATALHDWREALRAWKACGIDSAELRDDEISMPPVSACVRLNPDGEYPEVVWGTRLDAARIQVENVPFSRCERRYRDIILNDGAQSGTRTSGTFEVPVFDELSVWKPSPYSTFSAAIRLTDDEAASRLRELCSARDIGVEDWGTVRMLCEACSRGNPGAHVCSEKTETPGQRSYGFASTSREALVDVLDEWARATADVAFSEPHLELLAE